MGKLIKEFKITRIVSDEYMVSGGTETTYTYYGEASSSDCTQVTKELHLSLNPKIGGYIVIHDDWVEGRNVSYRSGQD